MNKYKSNTYVRRLGWCNGYKLDLQTFTSEFKSHWVASFIWPCTTSKQTSLVNHYIRVYARKIDKMLDAHGRTLS